MARLGMRRIERLMRTSCDVKVPFSLPSDPRLATTTRPATDRSRSNLSSEAENSTLQTRFSPSVPETTAWDQELSEYKQESVVEHRKARWRLAGNRDPSLWRLA